MIELIDKIKDNALRAFVFRVYNNIVAFGVIALPIFAVVLIDYIAKNDVKVLSDLFIWEVWDKILLIVLSQVLSSVVAGSLKANRTHNED